MKFIDFTVVLKHSGSSLPDLPAHVIIDAAARVVTIEVDAIDSTLILTLVSTVLQEEHGVIAFSDDNAGWTPPAPLFQLRIHFEGRHYVAHVTKLMGGAFTLRIDGEPLGSLP